MLPAAWVAGLSALPGAALAEDEAGWERKEFDCERPKEGCDEPACCEHGFGVWVRSRPGVDIREVKAVGEVDASPAKGFAVMTDYEHQPGNMPYVQSVKVLSRTESEAVFWTMADFPLVARRDWVLRARFERNVEGGKYRATWTVVDHKEAPPLEEGVVRLKVNDGSWTFEPLDGGKRCRATYYLFTHPGGSIPSFLANRANTRALPDVFAALRKLSAAR
jgi:ribosome-associated toxin RatA of RatAB toxin-antitoxin module